MCSTRDCGSGGWSPSRRAPRRWAERTAAPCPREVDPGILADFSDERVDQRPARRLGVDRREMRFRQHVSDEGRRAPGVDQVIDDQRAVAVAVHRLDNRWFALGLMLVGGDADSVDQPEVKLAGDDCRGHEAAAGDGHDTGPGPFFRQPPRQGLGVPVQLVPGNRKALLIGFGHSGDAVRILKHHTVVDWPIRPGRAALAHIDMHLRGLGIGARRRGQADPVGRQSHGGQGA